MFLRPDGGKMLITNRLKIYPLSIEELKEVVGKEQNEILKIAYGEMLDGCLKHPENYIWYTLLCIELRDSPHEVIGSLSFKGLNDNGVVEIGYGLKEEYENRGYMTEAVQEVVKWALKEPKVKQIEAEAEEDNIASIRVLEKCGFVPNGVMGEEGIRFVWKGGRKMEDRICQSCGMPITSEEQLGKNMDGSINPDYCKYCYENGEFIDKVTMEEYIEMCSEYGAQAGMTNEEMKEFCTKLFPTLKRWKND